MSAQLVLPETPIAIEPGGHAVCDALVRNMALVADRFTFEVVGAPTTWATVDPPVLELGPEASGRVRIRFHPPRAAHVRAGNTPFALLATSERDRSSALAEQLLALNRFFDTALELEQRAVRWRTARYSLGVINRGNATVRLQLSGRDLDGWLVVDCDPVEMTVFPGAAEYARVHVRLRRAPATPEPLSFQVVARSDGHDPLLATGRLAPRRRRLGWTLR